ncbi:hypothetical protein [Lysobacter gummosus]|uniref:hypothetical protein n=1 Tax=Lysobacter gummosus TaxID=262324 RepID=UPI003634C9CF
MGHSRKQRVGAARTATGPIREPARWIAGASPRLAPRLALETSNQYETPLSP